MRSIISKLISELINEDFNNVMIKLNHEDEEGLNEVINDIISLKNSDFYDKLYNTYKLGRKKINESDSGFVERLGNAKRVLIYVYSKNPSPYHFEHINSNIIILGNKYLTWVPPIFRNLISTAPLYYMYDILNCIYYINIGRKLNREDVENLFLSKLDERIMFALDKFDEIETTPNPEEKFFIKLKRTTWENKHAKTLFKDLCTLNSTIGGKKFGYLRFTTLRPAQNSFILLLAACNAVNHDRDKISKKDVVKAYKTYFKLFKTDISKYKANPYGDLKPDSKKSNNGYLVCEKCGGYYKLQEGESPDDFENCQCGGRLRYYENIPKLSIVS